MQQHQTKPIVLFLIFILSSFILISCTSNHEYVIVKTPNPKFVPNTAFGAAEDLTSPRFEAFRKKYQLDTIFHDEKDEFKRILLLRNWTRKHIMISDFEDDYPGKNTAEGILDAALKGQGFHCGHYMVVQNAVMNAYGYITRCLGAGPGVKGGPDGHHGSNEIWSNTFQKWFLSDAKYNHHFEKNGVPLSVLEVRDEFLKNGAADLQVMKGPDRKVIELDSTKAKKGGYRYWKPKDFAQTYTWIEFEQANDRFTHWPDNEKALNILNMYADDYFNRNTWIWDGKPHWAYNTQHMVKISDRNAFEWTPNTIETKVNLNGDSAYVQLHSITPNLKSYQMKTGEAWQDIGDSVAIKLNGEKNSFAFKAVNTAGVSGAETKLEIDRTR